MVAVDLDKYKEQLERELKTDNSAPQKSNYSQEYKQFLSEQVDTSKRTYSLACKFASKFIKAPIAKKDYEKVANYIQILHLNVTPQSTLSLAYFSAILVVVLSLISSVFMLSFYPLIFGLIAAVVVMYGLSKAPEMMFKSWRAQAADQLVNAVLYMVIYMEHTSNLEQAVYFAAKNLPPPLSLDFIRLLWNVESGKFSSVEESIEDYARIWQEWNPGFVESMHLLESSLYVRTDERRHEILDRTVNNILDTTQNTMMKYARDIQNPVQLVHMMGIILPVMGMVMLPMIASFLGDVISMWQIILFYNIFLPISVFLLARSTLNTRPAGINTTDIYDYYDYKHYKATLNIGSKRITMSPSVASLAVLALFLIAPVMYFSDMYTSGSYSLAQSNSLLALFSSLLIVMGIAFSLAVYYRLRVKDLVAYQTFLNKLDTEFANSVFQLGNRLEEGIPIETAFSKVAAAIPNSPVATLFNKIVENLSKTQSNLHDAIFEPKNGALSQINSSMIAGVMNIVVEGSKKGSQIVAFSLITISKFLTSVRNVNERLTDLLAETIASLQSEVKMFIPLITGIVVAMAVLTTNILLNLSERLSTINATSGSDSQLGFGTTLMDIFKIEYLMPSWAFQLIVGVYLIQVTLIMTYLLTGVVNGTQKVERYNAYQKNLFIGISIYFIITLVMSGLFLMLTRGIGSTV
jgi:Flp pilus assembly protein TadB